MGFRTAKTNAEVAPAGSVNVDAVDRNVIKLKLFILFEFAGNLLTGIQDRL